MMQGGDKPREPDVIEVGKLRLEGRLASRKLWISVATGLIFAALGLYGAVAWEFLIDHWVKVVLAYLGLQAGVDALRSWKG